MKFFNFIVIFFLFSFSTLIHADNSLVLNGYDSQLKTLPQTDPGKILLVVSNAPALLHNDNDPVEGNANGKVTLVEFFDYQCSHCIDTDPFVIAMMKTNPDLRVVYKELPIRGGVSTTAAKAALAAHKQGKYFAMHEALMRAGMGLTQDKILEIAKSLKLDMPKFTADMSSNAVDVVIKANYRLAQSLGIYGTPTLIGAPTNLSINNDKNVFFFIGELDYLTLQNLIANIKIT